MPTIVDGVYDYWIASAITGALMLIRWVLRRSMSSRITSWNILALRDSSPAQDTYSCSCRTHFAIVAAAAAVVPMKLNDRTKWSSHHLLEPQGF